MNLSMPELSAVPRGMHTSKSKRGKSPDDANSTTILVVEDSSSPSVNKPPIQMMGDGGNNAAVLLSSSQKATPGNSGITSKRKGLRVKVKGALRRMVSHDESIFHNKNNLVFKTDNDSTISNIHSTHSATSFPGSRTTSPIDGGNENGNGNANWSSSNLQTPSSSGKQSSKSNLTTKFNTSMRTLLAGISPRPAHSVIRRHQKLASKISPQVPLLDENARDGGVDVSDSHHRHKEDQFENDDEMGVRSDSDSNDDADDDGLGRKTARSHSPAVQRRKDRRDRKKAARVSAPQPPPPPSSLSSSAKFNNSNSRLRRRKYRRINTSQDAKNNTNAMTSSKDDKQENTNKTSKSQKNNKKKKKPLARSVPRTSSQKLIRVQQEEEGEPPVPGKNFLLSVLDDIQARMEASGELVVDDDDDDDNEDGNDNLERRTKTKKRSLGRKRGYQKNDNKGSPKSTDALSDTDCPSPEEEEVVALLAPELKIDRQDHPNKELEIGWEPNSLNLEGGPGDFPVFVEDSSNEDKKEEESNEMPPSLETMLEPESVGIAGDKDKEEYSQPSTSQGKEDSETPLMERSRSELTEEVEKSLKTFSPLTNKKRGISLSMELKALEKELADAKKDSFTATPDFNFNFSNVVSAHSTEGSPMSMDDSVVLDIRAFEKRRQREEAITLRRPTGVACEHNKKLARGRSCSDLQQEVSRPGMPIFVSKLDQFLNVGDLRNGLLNDLTPFGEKVENQGNTSLADAQNAQPEPEQEPEPQLQLLDKLEHARPGRIIDRSVGSNASQRGRSRNSRKRSSTTNGASNRRKDSRRRRKDNGRARVTKESSTGYRPRDRSGSNSRHAKHLRSDIQLPETRERSKSHSNRGLKSETNAKEVNRSIRKRISARHLGDRERSRSTSKEGHQSPIADRMKARERNRSNTRDLRRELYKRNKSNSESQIYTRDHSRSNKNSSWRELKQSEQKGKQTTTRRRSDGLHRSESLIDCHSNEVRGHRSKSKSRSKRLGGRGSLTQAHHISQSEQGRSQRRRCERLNRSEGVLDYHRRRSQSRSKSGRAGGERQESKQGKSSKPTGRSRRSSMRGHQSDSAVGASEDPRTDGSTLKVAKRQRSRSLERARRSKKIVDEAKEEIRRMANEEQLDHDAASKSLGSHGRLKQMTYKKMESKFSKGDMKGGDMGGKDASKKVQKQRPLSGSNDRLKPRKTGSEPSEIKAENSDIDRKAKHSDNETDEVNNNEDQGTNDKDVKSGHVQSRDKRQRNEGTKKSAAGVTFRKLRESQSERPTRTVDEAVAKGAASSSERHERRVSFETHTKTRRTLRQ